MDAPLFIPAPEAIQRLKAIQATYWMIDARAAIEHLGALLGRTDLLQLYQQFFPGKYRRSQASTRCEPPDGYSPREQEFFNLVRERLFPIAELCFEEDEERLDFIPVETQALDPEGLQDWKLTWQVLFGLVQGAFAEVNWNDVQAFLPAGADLPVFVARRAECTVDWKRVFRRAARSGPHLKHIRASFDCAAFETGNVWLDTTPDMLAYSELPDWNADEIAWLAIEWRKAKPILRRANAVVDWLDAVPSRLAALIRLWNRCTSAKEAKT